ncbi:hypothetical protein Ahy_A06g027672 [Arachis hypogaea]|uniref:Transposase MuDR plant domain-containing protein n=1 Tax=Arachis hypogaea TaxID=3818 RepID=A0A445CPJ8_ARAHY|nr:hypothetical protein Ahy_A06g027672 [Arachis hypogaea]
MQDGGGAGVEQTQRSSNVGEERGERRGAVMTRYRLRDDENVRLIRSWHNLWTNIHLLKLFVFLVELGGRGSSADTIDDTPLGGTVRRNIKRTMVDLNMCNPDDGDDVGNEPTKISNDSDEEEEKNYYGDTQIALIQPPVSRPYDCPGHFSRLNLNAMTLDWLFTHGGLEEDSNNEFEVGQQFENKEEVMLAVKRYSIKRDVEYKILESDQLKYGVQCIQFGPECSWNIHIPYRRKQKKWEVRRYKWYATNRITIDLESQLVSHVLQGDSHLTA